MSSDEEHVDQLSRDAMGGMTSELSEELVTYVDHESTDVAKKAIGAYEYMPKNEEERKAIDYRAVVSRLSELMQSDTDPELEVRIVSTLAFIFLENVDGHAPNSVTELTDEDKEWVINLLDYGEFHQIACYILGHIGDSSDIPRLEAIAETDEPDFVMEEAVREEATKAIKALSSSTSEV